MALTPRALMVTAGLGSLALLLGAWAFQAAGYPPCKLCIWQRWPHGLAAALGLAALINPAWPVAVAGALAALTTGGVGAYHAGVERGWWPGPSTCSSGDVSGLSTADLMDQIMNAPLVRCDEVAWSLAGISMAGWNFLLSLGLAAIWLAAAWLSAR